MLLFIPECPTKHVFLSYYDDQNINKLVALRWERWSEIQILIDNDSLSVIQL